MLASAGRALSKPGGRHRTVSYMRQLIVLCGGILALVLIASGLYVNLPGYQAIGLTAFGACIAGMGFFAWNVAVEDKRRGDHDH